MKLISLFFICIPLLLASCGNSVSDEENKKALLEAEKHWKSNKGIGQVTSVKLGALKPELIKEGEQLFKTKCMACHRKTERKLIGPGLSKILTKRTPEWTMNMIINPQKMIKEDKIAKSLFNVYKTPMLDLGIKEKEARSILEYMRTI